MHAGINNGFKVDENTEELDFDVQCSYLEIYNENIIDLLDISKTKVILREDKTTKTVYPDPCTVEQVSALSDVINLIKRGT